MMKITGDECIQGNCFLLRPIAEDDAKFRQGLLNYDLIFMCIVFRA
jgi:hypothetical protein